MNADAAKWFLPGGLVAATAPAPEAQPRVDEDGTLTATAAQVPFSTAALPALKRFRESRRRNRTASPGRPVAFVFLRPRIDGAKSRACGDGARFRAPARVNRGKEMIVIARFFARRNSR